MDSQLMRQAQALVEQWRSEFIRVMQAMGDLRPEMEVRFAPPPRGSSVLWWNQPLDLAPGAAVWIGTAEETWATLGQRVLAAAGIGSSGPSELKETYLEVLRQSLAVLARVVSSQSGREVTATAGAEQEPSANLAFGFQVTVRIGDEELPGFGCFVSQQMLEALTNCTSDEADSRLIQPAANGEDIGTGFPARAYGTLDLLLDLEMPVSVSFGRTQVRIQNILKLTTGSIIEMDRSISEPVEVIVNNCTVARGEVVVVDGSYGVRINEVLSRTERLQESRKYLLPASGSRH